jgi:hypothetical protein
MDGHTSSAMSERLFGQAVVAMEAGTQPRYAREWLEQQAVAGILILDGGSASRPDTPRRCWTPTALSGPNRWYGRS